MDKRFDYFLRNFSLFYDIDINSLSYGGDKVAPISIIQNVDSSFWYEKKDIETTNFVWKKLGEKNIPFLFEKNSTTNVLNMPPISPSTELNITVSNFFGKAGAAGATIPPRISVGTVCGGLIFKRRSGSSRSISVNTAIIRLRSSKICDA